MVRPSSRSAILPATDWLGAERVVAGLVETPPVIGIPSHRRSAFTRLSNKIPSRICVVRQPLPMPLWNGRRSLRDRTLLPPPGQPTNDLACPPMPFPVSSAVMPWLNMTRASNLQSFPVDGRKRGSSIPEILHAPAVRGEASRTALQVLQ